MLNKTKLAIHNFICMTVATAENIILCTWEIHVRLVSVYFHMLTFRDLSVFQLSFSHAISILRWSLHGWHEVKGSQANKWLTRRVRDFRRYNWLWPHVKVCNMIVTRNEWWRVHGREENWFNAKFNLQTAVPQWLRSGHVDDTGLQKMI